MIRFTSVRPFLSHRFTTARFQGWSIQTDGCHCTCGCSCTGRDLSPLRPYPSVGYSLPPTAILFVQLDGSFGWTGIVHRTSGWTSGSKSRIHRRRGGRCTHWSSQSIDVRVLYVKHISSPFVSVDLSVGGRNPWTVLGSGRGLSMDRRSFPLHAMVLDPSLRLKFSLV